MSILPPEVIRVILGNLEQLDLLNCRLVSQSWKQECTYLLLKSDTCLRLNENNIGQYVNFVEHSSYQISILQLHIEIETETSSESIENRLDQLSAQVDKLNFLLGFDVIKKVTFYASWNTISVEVLAKFLSKISAGVEYLDLSSLTLTSSSEQNLMQECHLILPKLNKCCIIGLNTNITLTNIVKILEMCTNFNYLKAKYFGGFISCKNLFRSITKLHYIDTRGYSELLQAIQLSSFVPQIRKFKFGWFKWMERNGSIIEEILKRFAHSLISLTLTVMHYWTKTISISFPIFPILQHFQLKNSTGNYTDRSRISLITLDPTKLPSLTSLELPMNWNFVQASSNASHPINSMLFPSVTDVLVRCNDSPSPCPYDTEWLSIKDDCRRLKELLAFFPNASNVAITKTKTKLNFSSLTTYYKTYPVNKVKYVLAKQTLDNCSVKTVEILHFEVAYVEFLLNRLEVEVLPPKVLLGKFPRISRSRRDKLRSLVDKYESKRLQLYNN